MLVGVVLVEGVPVVASAVGAHQEVEEDLEEAEAVAVAAVEVSVGVIAVVVGEVEVEDSVGVVVVAVVVEASGDHEQYMIYSLAPLVLYSFGIFTLVCGNIPQGEDGETSGHLKKRSSHSLPIYMPKNDG